MMPYEQIKHFFSRVDCVISVFLTKCRIIKANTEFIHKYPSILGRKLNRAKVQLAIPIVGLSEKDCG